MRHDPGSELSRELDRAVGGAGVDDDHLIGHTVDRAQAVAQIALLVADDQGRAEKRRAHRASVAERPPLSSFRPAAKTLKRVLSAPTVKTQLVVARRPLAGVEPELVVAAAVAVEAELLGKIDVRRRLRLDLSQLHLAVLGADVLVRVHVVDLEPDPEHVVGGALVELQVLDPEPVVLRDDGLVGGQAVGGERGQRAHVERGDRRDREGGAQHHVPDQLPPVDRDALQHPIFDLRRHLGESNAARREARAQ